MRAVRFSECISNKLANLSFVAACLVVTIHMPTGGWFRNVFSIGIAQAMVPIFFLISGLFARVAVYRYGWKDLFRRKFFSLFVPYVLLNLIVYGFACIELCCGRPWSFSPKMVEISFGTVLLSLGVAKTRWCFLYPLWFIRCLIFLFCLSPIILRFLSCGRKGVWLTLGVMALMDILTFVLGLRSEFIVLASYWFNPTGLFCFTLGMVLGMHLSVNSANGEIGLLKSRFLWSGVTLLCAIVCALLPYLPQRWITEAMRRYFIVPTVAISLYSLMPFRRFPAVLIRNTFGLYVLHALVIHYSHFFGSWVKSEKAAA